MPSASMGWAVRPADTSYPVVQAPVDTTGSGDITMIAAPGAGYRIKIWRLQITFDAVTSVIAKSAATTLTGNMNMAAVGACWTLDASPAPWFTCGYNEAFILNLSAAADMNGFITYSVEQT